MFRMKSLLGIFIFLLPLHAFLVTVLKCRFDVNTDILRFWKEWILTFLVLYLFTKVLRKNDFSLRKIYSKNTLLWLSTAFIICSAIYIIFPFFQLKLASVLWFRYDTYFLIAMIVWLYCGLQNDLRYFVKTLFLSTFGILIIFLPWYLTGNIADKAALFWYSSEVSTYVANTCISFAQNVEWHHRFQGTFWWPIRFSVFLTVVYSLFAWWLFSSSRFVGNTRYYMLGWFAALVLPSIFFSYSKTSMLGFVFAVALFVLLSYKYIYKRKITKTFYFSLAGIITVPIALIALLKWELFLHLWSVLNRVDNLTKSVEMFFYNPFWYGLWIAGPASQMGHSIESAGNWQIATSSVFSVHKFLPENWYVQILLEQGLIGFFLFISLIILIGLRLIESVKRSRDFMQVGITTAYFALCFMALFTHAFEEAATSYILFFLIGLVLTDSMQREKNAKK